MRLNLASAKRGQVGLVRHSELYPSAGGKGRVFVRCRLGGRETRAAAVRWEGCTRALTKGPAGGGDAVRKGGARDGEVRALGGSRRWGRAHAGEAGWSQAGQTWCGGATAGVDGPGSSAGPGPGPGRTAARTVRQAKQVRLLLRHRGGKESPSADSEGGVTVRCRRGGKEERAARPGAGAAGKGGGASCCPRPDALDVARVSVLRGEASGSWPARAGVSRGSNDDPR